MPNLHPDYIPALIEYIKTGDPTAVYDVAQDLGHYNNFPGCPRLKLALFNSVIRVNNLKFPDCVIEKAGTWMYRNQCCINLTADLVFVGNKAVNLNLMNGKTLCDS